MLEKVLVSLSGFPLREHETEGKLAAALLGHLNGAGLGSTWVSKKAPRSPMILGRQGIPDVVCCSAKPSIAIEVKYIRAKRVDRSQDSGDLFWEGLGQAMANALAYDASVLFLQSDVGVTERNYTLSRLEVPLEEVRRIAREEWKVEIVWVMPERPASAGIAPAAGRVADKLKGPRVPYYARRTPEGRVVTGGGSVPDCDRCGKKAWTPLGVILRLCDEHLRNERPVDAGNIRTALKSGSYSFAASRYGTVDELAAELKDSLGRAGLFHGND